MCGLCAPTLSGGRDALLEPFSQFQRPGHNHFAPSQVDEKKRHIEFCRMTAKRLRREISAVEKEVQGCSASHCEPPREGGGGWFGRAEQARCTPTGPLLFGPPAPRVFPLQTARALLLGLLVQPCCSQGDHIS
eukprot:gene12171-biopygen3416